MTGRPKTYKRKRMTTSIRFPDEMLAALHQAADERDISVNFLVNRAVVEFLDRLIPPDEIKFTR